MILHRRSALFCSTKSVLLATSMICMWNVACNQFAAPEESIFGSIGTTLDVADPRRQWLLMMLMWMVVVGVIGGGFA